MQFEALTLIIMMVGVLICLAILVKSALKISPIPPLIGYIALGFAVRILDVPLGFLTPEAWNSFSFLSTLGIITVLFRVGLESNIAGLIRQFPRASIIWVANVLMSAALGYLAARSLLNLPEIPSMFVATALTATSMSISVVIWQEAGTIHTPLGELLIDVAELDDISGVVLMALLFTLAPVIKASGVQTLLPIVLKAGGIFALKLVGFGALCLLFSRYLEQHITNAFMRITPAPDLALLVAGIGFIIASFAEVLGFSVAIGAMFAGLVFSRDPQAVKIDASFGSLYELFSPFFFIEIGLLIDPASLTSAMGIGLIILIARFIGKSIGAGMPAFFMTGWLGANLIGFSMVPQAEIAMIIMQHGRKLGPWAVAQDVFSGMVLVTAFTCLFSPLIIRGILLRWPVYD
jgi:Kef-type K+ transport system membrane component KefB